MNKTPLHTLDRSIAYPIVADYYARLTPGQQMELLGEYVAQITGQTQLKMQRAFRIVNMMTGEVIREGGDGGYRGWDPTPGEWFQRPETSSE